MKAKTAGPLTLVSAETLDQLDHELDASKVLRQESELKISTPAIVQLIAAARLARELVPLARSVLSARRCPLQASVVLIRADEPREWLDGTECRKCDVCKIRTLLAGVDL